MIMSLIPWNTGKEAKSNSLNLHNIVNEDDTK